MVIHGPSHADQHRRPLPLMYNLQMILRAPWRLKYRQRFRLANLHPPGDTVAEQVPQPSSSNGTQDTAGQPEPTPTAVPIPKKSSILKTADSLKSSDGYKRNISWQDQYGQSLTQVVEFEPSTLLDYLTASSFNCQTFLASHTSAKLPASQLQHPAASDYSVVALNGLNEHDRLPSAILALP
ncbi:hypothetical protein VOLCADRAFT_105758 [Volvox carteri f. nagariensis]|uniref:Uncharacterized protein n=1 Tax=Volvox carteri f. nagariensis TaxID=3068 RepID=D8U2V8_VOLCA|nr:uncharacterized protein VOLCADRAFT_105758 [Volvox carteri f. nagariensis]EFJ45876.1 hypothetical protein VOLCADRAFT_105758 [Volvox carteri f. nagariensis]|eukprot:XP_002952954.1 hypothetical protein VOLCADRAFT_105758 [Volvox carteri f. nagariensis]